MMFVAKNIFASNALIVGGSGINFRRPQYFISAGSGSGIRISNADPDHKFSLVSYLLFTCFQLLRLHWKPTPPSLLPKYGELLNAVVSGKLGAATVNGVKGATVFFDPHPQCCDAVTPCSVAKRAGRRPGVGRRCHRDGGCCTAEIGGNASEGGAGSGRGSPKSLAGKRKLEVQADVVGL